MGRTTPVLGVMLCLVLGVRASDARRIAPGANLAPASRAAITEPAGPALSAATAGVLQLWTFDNAGNPDPQGWSTYDRTAQPPYFHIDTYLALTAPRGVWCGAIACASPELCSYATLPGYGNNWDQTWMSIPFTPSASSMTIAFDMHYDTEPTYDMVYLEFSTTPAIWTQLGSWSGLGTTSVSKTIIGGAPARFRLRFHSDDSDSDEDGLFPTDGAVQIDNLQVSGATVVDSHSFTNDTNQATATNDGHWQAYGSAYGNYAALFDGDGVYQEDAYTFNPTNMWAFFSGSPANYACGGQPGQAAVPFVRTDEGVPFYLHDEIQSPGVSLTGVSSTEPVLLSLDMYPDLPTDNLVYYEYRVRSRVAGVWKNWKQNGFVYNNAAKSWQTFTYNLRPLIESGATDIMVGIAARDMCFAWCGLYGSGACHSNGPLIDNVRITTSNTATGNSVYIQPVDPITNTTPVSVLFAQITSPGLTTLTTGATGPPMPGAFQLNDGTYYNLSTTATNAGNVQVCITYDQAALTVPESSLRLLHWDTSLEPDAWVDITQSLDTTNNIICGNTSHLSPFVIGGGSLTAVGDAPHRFALLQNVPNPFNPVTSIRYEVPAGGARVSMRIYDAAGRLVRTLVDEFRPAGLHEAVWDGRDGFGNSVSSGVYFYRMVAGNFSTSRHMVLLK